MARPYTLKHFTKSSICLFYSWVFASSPVGIAGNQHQHIKQTAERAEAGIHVFASGGYEI